MDVERICYTSIHYSLTPKLESLRRRLGNCARVRGYRFAFDCEGGEGKMVFVVDPKTEGISKVILDEVKEKNIYALALLVFPSYKKSKSEVEVEEELKTSSYPCEVQVFIGPVQKYSMFAFLDSASKPALFKPAKN
jgi:hypothetical protein